LAARPNDSVNDGNLPIVILAAMHQDMELSAPGQRENIIARVAGLKTRGDAANYLNQVAAKHSTGPVLDGLRVEHPGASRRLRSFGTVSNTSNFL
jgi:hypothetical protein